jgi:hypothetical protein
MATALLTLDDLRAGRPIGALLGFAFSRLTGAVDDHLIEMMQLIHVPQMLIVHLRTQLAWFVLVAVSSAEVS